MSAIAQGRALLEAAMGGDLAAGRALCDWLADSGDDRLPGFRQALGSLACEVLDNWEDAAEAADEIELKWGPAAATAEALDQFVRWCHAAFWDWLLTGDDLAEAQRLLARSVELAGPAEVPR